MWPEYLHHLFLQIPISGAIGLSILGVAYVRQPAQNLEKLLRYMGWGLFFCIIAASVSGILSAPGALGGAGPEELSHHRNMGLMVFFFAASSAIAFEVGIRDQTSASQYIKKTAALMWIAVALSAVGAGHWGGSVVHSDQIPWDKSQPAIQKLKK